MPAFKATRELVGLTEPVAGMDLSDGLLSTMFDLAAINGLGINLNEAAIPISARAADVARQFSIDPLRFAFGTGDWEIAFVLDQADWKRIQGSCQSIHAIGAFTGDHTEVRLTRQDGQVRPLKRIEQEHFLNTSADRSFLEYLLEAPLY
jgi:thiamine monophosphate kinase